MKRVLFLLVSAFVCLSASAKVSGIEDAKKGDFNLGLQLGVPAVDKFENGHDPSAIPTISLDASWVLTSGFINTKAFGQNGAIDLGLYYGFCHYSYDEHSVEETLNQNIILCRSGFHFQFVPNLDTYAGAFAGANLWMWEAEGPGYEDDNTDTDACFGLFTGAKYYFSDLFGVKLEFGHDFNEDNYPLVAGGITFRF
ncbi:MAG: outer membrane beta-barrel protein [Paludibacteraceae bacterium]|nr:outer membrane beta-barrel protein [Paludibacteraceae bacterium]